MKPASSGDRTGSDRWLVSYADLMTLLFALFATLYASSTVDTEKMASTASSMQAAFSLVPASAAGAYTDMPEGAPLTLSEIDPDEALARRLAAELGDAIAERRLEIMRDPRGLIVSLPDDATFPTGSAEPTLEARTLILRVGDTLRSATNAMRIEGHTDNVPIRTARFASNWELSTARASSVVAFLVNEVGIQASRLSAAGYGEFHPLEPNDTPERRARNRRVDLVILDARDARERATPPVTGGEGDAAP